jgi:hypothetical protein
MNNWVSVFLAGVVVITATLISTSSVPKMELPPE